MTTKKAQAAKRLANPSDSKIAMMRFRRTTVAAAVGLIAAAASANLSAQTMTVGQTESNLIPISDDNDNFVALKVDTNPAAVPASDTTGTTSSATASSPNTLSSGNTAINYSSILLDGGGTTIGLRIRGTNSMTATAVADDSRSSNGALAGSASATSTANSQTTVDGNEARNTSLITAVKGVQLEATSFASASATATSNISANTDGAVIETGSASASATANATANSQLTGNRVFNSGDITALMTVGIGIELLSTARAGAYRLADATATSGSGGATSSETMSGTSSAIAAVSGNVIDNSGTLISAGRGLSVSAVAGGVTIQVGGTAVAANPDSASATVSGNNVTNTGLIASYTSGVNLDGVRLQASATGTSSIASVTGNTIVNRGSIYSMDDGIQLDIDAISSAGSALVTGNTISNFYGGRIVAENGGIEIGATTPGGGGLEQVSGNTVNNSGLIVSDNGLTVNSDGSITKGARASFIVGRVLGLEGPAVAANVNTLNLLAPAYHAGHFDLERTANVAVTLTSGISHSVRWVFKDTTSGTAYGAQEFTVTDPVPWFTNMADGFVTTTGDAQDNTDDIFATIDPSAFAAAPNQLTDLTGMASSMAAEGMNRSGVTRNGFWMAVRGSRMDYKGDNLATMDQDTRLQGGAFGFNRDFGDLRVGVMAGYADSELEVGSFYPDLYRYSHENSADGGFAGLHIQGNLGAVSARLGLMAGVMDHEDRRFVNDNLQWWGESYARATYDSRWYAPELSLSVPVAITETITLTPSLHGRYSVQKFDRYTETGSNSNATVHDHTIKMGEVRAGLDLTKKYAGGSTAGVQVGYLQRDLAGKDTVRVTMIGDTKEVPFFTRDLGAGYASVKFNLAITKAVSFQVDGTYINGSEGDGGNVGAKLNVEF